MERAVERFREYLQIKTVQPDPDYEGAKKFLQRQAEELSLPVRVLELVAGKPIILISWEGTNPTLSSVLLNSHIDVVPVYPECWDYDPFSAHIDEHGDIYARGTQDMKCVGIQYIEAVRKLKDEGQTFPRTIHMSFVPDEEIGGEDGMKLFLETEDFRQLNVGFALDEGLANPTSAYSVYYGERQGCHLQVTCTGTPGHGSLFVQNDAGSKMLKVIAIFMKFREEEETRLANNSDLKLGDVTTVNLTKLSGGVQSNVVPAELQVVFDIRVTPFIDYLEFRERLERWCQEIGDGVTIEFLLKNPLKQMVTPTNQEDKWWNAFKISCEKLNIEIDLGIFPAGTDSRYLRNMGIPVLGFSPMNNTPVLLHENNERLNQTVFLNGISIYTELLPALACVSD